jgi:phage-related protein
MDRDAAGRRPVVWTGSSKADFKAFPEPVQKDLGVALFLVQLGRLPPSAKPWHGLGAGVYELVDDHASGTYRCVFIVRFPEAIYVLHAFHKKSKRGRRTPQTDIVLVATRLRSLIQRRGATNER